CPPASLRSPLPSHPPPSLTLFFFFQRYAAHPDLHSFPTRRSSDLLEQQAEFTRVDLEPRRIALRQAERAALQPLVKQAVSAAGEDRKSTRLNSSHDQISYAVFCLKKKKKKKK